jgi:ankyrin repeat protein
MNQTPLHTAAKRGDGDTILYMTSLVGVQPDVLSKDNHSALSLAAGSGKIDLNAFLILFNHHSSPFYKAVGKNGDNILHVACRGGSFPLIKQVFVFRKHYANVKNFSQRLPVHEACVSGCKEAVELLVSEFPTTIAAMDIEGNTPLIVSSIHGHLPIVQFLLKNGVEVAVGDQFEPPIYPALKKYVMSFVVLD